MHENCSGMPNFKKFPVFFPVTWGIHKRSRPRIGLAAPPRIPELTGFSCDLHNIRDWRGHAWLMIAARKLTIERQSIGLNFLRIV